MKLVDFRFDRPGWGGRAECIFTMEPPVTGLGGLLPVQVWFMLKDTAFSGVAVNAGVSISWSEQRSGSSFGPQVLKTYCEAGTFGSHGSTAGMGAAAIWNTAVSLDDEMIRRLQTTHSPEYGLGLEIEVSGTIIPLYNGGELPLPFTVNTRNRVNMSAASWRTVRDALGWPRPRSFELNPGSFSDLSEFEMAHKNLRKAERQLLAGAWEESIATSRLVAEAVLRGLGYKKRHSMKWNAMKEAGYPQEVANLLQAFNGLTSLEHHPTGHQHQWTRADARLVFHTAAMLAEYAGTLPPYESSKVRTPAQRAPEPAKPVGES